MIKRFCNVCHDETARNMVTSPLMVEQKPFIVQVAVTVKDDVTDPDLCYDCLIKMLTTPAKKPRKTRSDKGTHKGYALEDLTPPGDPPAETTPTKNRKTKEAQ